MTDSFPISRRRAAQRLRQSRFWIPGLALATGLMGPGNAGCSRRSAAPPPPLAVQSVPVETRPVEHTVAASGSIYPDQTLQLGFMVGGRLLELPVHDGAAVRTGDLLARLDPADCEKQLRIAEARRDEVRSRHERLSRLHALGSLTDADFDQIVAGLKEAESACELAQRQLGYTELRAPAEGLAVVEDLEPGMVLPPGRPVLGVVIINPVRAHLAVPERDMPFVQLGQRVQIALPALGGEEFTGEIEQVGAVAEPLARTFEIKVRLANPAGHLRPGNIVLGHIHTGRMESCVLIPLNAVNRDADDTRYVWRLDPTSRTIFRRTVQTGRLEGQSVEILSGLTTGETIAIGPEFQLYEGARVDPGQP